MPGGYKGPLRDDPTSYRRTGIPCGNPSRYQSRAVTRMVPDGKPFRDQRMEIPVEDIETEGDRQLKELVKKQLDTDITLEGQLSQKRAFTQGVQHVPLGHEVAGSRSLREYHDATEQERRVEELRQLGLTDDEIEFKFECQDKLYDPKASKKARYGPDPEAHQARLDMIDRKIRGRQKARDQPDTFTGAKYMSRHEMDLEQAISHDQDKSRLLGVLMTNQKPEKDLGDPDHPINHLDSIFDDLMRHKERERVPWCATREESLKDVKSNTESTVENRQNSDSVHPVHTDGAKCTCSMQSNDAQYPYGQWQLVDNASSRKKDAPSSQISKSDGSKFQSNEKGSRTLSNKVEPIPLEIIEKYRLSTEQIRELPRFKDYSPGEPSKTLYLKNLASKVSGEDLVAMFIGFEKPEGPKISFKLMTGKMKGQAFVTFGDEEAAREALEAVNGYDFKGRPVIIQFGRKT